ncbi:amine oxidase flavin-containing superfamily [Penicillium manginii]|jgi:hypothetical protein|uniref:amine oxidase flavin-containing superfamily n=1 Tax=Penicillium manginii TaxID=203109 RepID=UPI0025466F96|nr:amine oxidase flavin-containing superfamily [Penicillium manginii]KAJ5740080.1 amine oxidase flavin-containing superfamily [Penicillium manginii]
MKTAIDTTQGVSSEVITRDVCIIGGGAAGTYAAIRLRQMNKDVVVVEKEPCLGGHTMTYSDSEPGGKAVNYGVRYFQNLSTVRSFFAYFGIPLERLPFGNDREMFDFRAGKKISPVSQSDADAATGRYVAQLNRYPYLKGGFELPEPVPEDLLLPFGQFMAKHNLWAYIDELGAFINPLGDDWPQLPTLYVMKYANLTVLEGMRSGFVRSGDHNNSAIYSAAERELGEDALLSSSVVAVDRDRNDGWNLVTVRKAENRKPWLIRARRIIVAIPPKLENMRCFDLGSDECRLFGQFQNTYLYTMVVGIKGLPVKDYANRVADDPFKRPRLPGILFLASTDAPHLKTVQVGSTTSLSEEELKRVVFEDILRLRQCLGINFSNPEFLAIADHSPYQLTVSADAIKKGFYREINTLQGIRHTFYTGAAFESHNTPQVWDFTEDLLQKFVLPSFEQTVLT